MSRTGKSLDPRDEYVDIYEQYMDSPSLASNDAVFEQDMASNVMTTPLLNIDGQFGAPREYYMQNSSQDNTIGGGTGDESDSSLDDLEELRLHQLAIENRRLKYTNYQHQMQHQLPGGRDDEPNVSEKIIEDDDGVDEGAAKIITQINQETGLMISKTVRKSIKDFKIGKDLGEGSYSTVVLATDMSSNVNYAIKMLNKRYIIKEDKVKYVKLEKDALNRLNNHHGIVHLHYTFQDAMNLYFVLDFAENGELLTLIKRYNTMDEESTRYYSIQLIDAIDYMHRNGVIHRDLKPENILIDKEFKIQITDFGTAKLLDKSNGGEYPQDARAKSFVGTAEYVSPELLNDKSCGRPADIWALGCIIYQMIGGKPPFKGANEYLTFQKVQKLQYAFTAGFPIVIRDLIKRLLILKPGDRLTIEQIKMHYWFRACNWSEGEIWGVNPPPLSAYKISAKSMKPIPELEQQYKSRKVSSNRKSSSSSTLSSSQKVMSSPNIAPPPIPGRVGPKNASNAAYAALYGVGVGGSSPGPVSGPPSSGPPLSSTSTSAIASGAATAAAASSSSAPAVVMVPATARSRKSSSNGSKSGPKNVIPGTNIARPVLHTKIPKRKSHGSGGGGGGTTTNTTTTNIGVNSIPQLSVLDLKWVKYMKHRDERVIKAGVVRVQKEPTVLFERKNRGCITESPLGYMNKDKDVSSLGIVSSIGKFAIDYKREEINVGDLSNEDHDGGNSSSNGNGGSNKFMKFFTPRTPPPSTSIEVMFQSRILVITTIGRAMVFNAMGNEMTMEIDLTNGKVKFVEVLTPGDGKLGLFAIETPDDTLIFQCEIAEVSHWTTSLFKSRRMEKDRLEDEFHKMNGRDERMVAAAVSKAVSMASVNAGVGVGAGSGANTKSRVTPMNSKLLARSRMR